MKLLYRCIPTPLCPEKRPPLALITRTPPSPSGSRSAFKPFPLKPNHVTIKRGRRRLYQGFLSVTVLFVLKHKQANSDYRISSRAARVCVCVCV
ncbi:hypothetical protein QQF64_021499 [Cirrhinus molitorella]|uniref:Uncharacterized protein n=1 Tax=Cirrhinus molitorella TaxID=172907 RepID=A0ABR3L5I0_9TELE